MIVLSIVVPIYNVEAYLEQCLASLLDNKNHSMYEVILVDDCATDSSRSIAEAFVSNEPKAFKLLTHSKNSGLSAARNTGMPHCVGEYIMFVDSDDWLAPHAIDTILELLINEQPELILFDHERVYDNRSEYSCFDSSLKTFTYLPPENSHNTLMSMSLNAWSKVFLNTKLNGYTFPEGIVFEDLAVIPAIVASCEKTIYLPQALYKYRQREGSLVSTFVSEPSKIFPALECLYSHYLQTENSAFEYISVRELMIYQPRSLYSIKGSNKAALKVLKNNAEWISAHYPNWRKNQHLKSTKKGVILSLLLKFINWRVGQIIFLLVVSYDKVLAALKIR